MDEIEPSHIGETSHLEVVLARAPCTRIKSWPSATCSAGDCVSVLVAALIEAPSVRRSRSSVLQQPEDVAIGVGDGGHQAAATDVAHGLLHGGTRGGHLGQLRLDVRHVPVGHR
jgi:hypothetical protein